MLLASLLILVPARADDARIEKLLAEMTLEEKVGQLSQWVPDQPELAPAIARGQAGALLNTSGAAQVNELQRATLAASRLKVPLLVGHDVVHGYRTIFPIPLAVAASWDPELAELSARVAAREARGAGIRWTFAPMVDVARDARWGRIAESSGEDPFLGSAFAAAYVRGFQDAGLLACAKHFAAYGAAEGGRDYGRADISERTLREVYLPPFRAAVDAGVASLMSSFNTIGDVPSTANRRLLTTILREEWGFRGFVVSDWAAIAELIPHGVAATREEAARKAITAGVDMAMWDGTYLTLAGAVHDGRIPQKTIDEAVRRVLRAKFKAGLFADPFTSETTTPLARDLARRIAQRSIVLLKNEKALLPLAKTTKIHVLGTLADSGRDMLGPWAAQGKPEETVTVRAGLRNAKAILVESLEAADVVVAVFGETENMAGEAASRASLDLDAADQKKLEDAVAAGKPVVLLVMSGRPLSIAWAAEHVPAIVQTWFLGTEGGNAIADVLFGDVNPSAKLPVTVPRHAGQSPIYSAELPTGRPADAENRFTSRYRDVPVGPLFPFGHGLSYTTFEYTDLKIETETVSGVIRNAGTRAGEEVVQFYVRRAVSDVSHPVRELKGFRRVSLRPGETIRVSFPIPEGEFREFWVGGLGMKVE
jgi:beta-glucosidase